MSALRFRFATGPQGSRQIAESFGRGMDTLFLAPLMELQGREQAMDAEMKRSLMRSQQNEAEAKAALYGQQADAARTQNQRGTLPELVTTAARMNRIGPEQIPELQQYIESGGHLAGKYELPPGQQGPILPKPEYADQSGLGGSFTRTLGMLQGALTVGGDIEKVTGAQGNLQKQDLTNEAAQYARSGADDMTMSRLDAVLGNKEFTPYKAVGTTGTTVNEVTGTQNVAHPGMYSLFTKEQLAQTNQHNAAAGASSAQAAHSRALTQQTQQQIAQGQRAGDNQIVTAADGSITLVNKATGEARPVVGPGGQPVIRGGAGGGGKPLTGDQAKANLFGARMLESDKILSELEDKGVTNTGITRNIVQGTVGVLPLIGDKLSEAAGSGMNLLPGALGGPSSEQQQVDQARRDFINAVLRRESGAAIAPSEFENANKQYFPQPGDSKAVLVQKRRNRQIATTLMLQEVPEAQRYRPGAAPTQVAPAVSQTGGATGSWGDAPAGWSIQKVN